MTITPIGERVLIMPLEDPEKTKGGIYIPESAREGKKQGKVIAVGTMKEAGRQFPVTVNDVILYGGYSNEDFEIDGQKYIVIELKDVVAKIGE